MSRIESPTSVVAVYSAPPDLRSIDSTIKLSAISLSTSVFLRNNSGKLVDQVDRDILFREKQPIFVSRYISTRERTEILSSNDTVRDT